MKPIQRSLLPLLLALPLATLSPVGVQAQGTCGQCDRYFGGCDEPCTYCRGFYPDGGCIREVESTCGAFGAACIPSGCTPNFVETARENRGTYGNGSLFSCSHHAVDWVTRTDSNQCNTQPAYRTISTCEDYLDLPGKEGLSPDCCNSYGPGGEYDPRYSCNHQHSC